jgi:transposase
MRYWAGFDIGKAFHWLCVLDDEGGVVLSRRVEATEEDIEAACSQIQALGSLLERAVAVDMVGGPATLLEAALLGHGERVFYMPGMSVNRAREGYQGEQKSDRGDARLIADQLRMRWRSLRELQPQGDEMVEMRLLVSHRRDLVTDQARCITRLRALLNEVFPGLDALLDFHKDRAFVLLGKVSTPDSAKKLGASRLARWLRARGIRRSDELAQKVIEAAKAQNRQMPASEARGALVREMAADVLRIRERIGEIEGRLEELLSARPEAEVVRSLPGMGVVFTASFLAEVGDLGRFDSADALAAAAGLVPATRQSGGTSFQMRARRGNRTLKNLFYRSAFSCTAHHAPSKAFYDRKRAEGKTHHQAVIALARRRVNVLWTMLRNGQLYEDRSQTAA